MPAVPLDYGLRWMLIYDREFPDAETIDQLIGDLMAAPGLWTRAGFAAAARSCGCKRISERKSGYFAFTIFDHVTGQAPLAGDMIEEIRFFIGSEPKSLATEVWERDQALHGVLARACVKRLKLRFGRSRRLNDNWIFESEHYRVRVLVGPPLWVVLSSLAVVRQLPADWWAAGHR